MNQLYHTPREQGPRIVAIGGGHGLSNMLRGLKRYTENLSAIVTVADDGGGSGMTWGCRLPVICAAAWRRWPTLSR